MNAVEGVVHSVTGKFIALRRREGFQAVLGDPTTRTRDRAFFSRQYIIRYHPFVFFFFQFSFPLRSHITRTHTSEVWNKRVHGCGRGSKIVKRGSGISLNWVTGNE
jgi:hypothetical protein